eukprot:5316444-Prymnesium_polylepis.1
MTALGPWPPCESVDRADAAESERSRCWWSRSRWSRSRWWCSLPSAGWYVSVSTGSGAPGALESTPRSAASSSSTIV